VNPATPTGGGYGSSPGAGAWLAFLGSQDPAYPEKTIERDRQGMQERLAAMRRDTTPPERRLADNMLSYNPVASESLVQLMWGALMPGRPGGLLNARLRYFDPDRRRAGVPDDVAALVSAMSDASTTVTLINLNRSQPRTVVVQGGGYGEHRLVSGTRGGKTTPNGGPPPTPRAGPGGGGGPGPSVRTGTTRAD